MSRTASVVASSAQLTPIPEQSVDVPPFDEERAPLSAEQSALLFELRCLLGGIELRLLQRMQGLEEVLHKNRRGTPWSENMHTGVNCGPGSTLRKHTPEPCSQSSTDCDGFEPDGSSPEARVRFDLSNRQPPSRIVKKTNPRLASKAGAFSRHSYSTDDMLKMEKARKFGELNLPQDPQLSTSRRTVGAFVCSPTFEVTFAVLIAMNALMMGVEIEISARFRSGHRHLFFFIADAVFAAIFLVELLLRVYVLRCGFFRRENKFWGFLDTLLVGSSLIEAFIESMAIFGVRTETGVSDGNQLRLFRILRITRAVRTLRMTRLVRFVASLRTLITSILSTLNSLLWALLLLLILIYGAAIAFTEAATNYLLQTGEDLAMEARWGTLPKSMFTLYQSISGGVDWNDAVDPLHDISIGYVALFSVYIFFTSFAVLNVLTGVFCQSAIDTVSCDPDLAAQAAIVQRKGYLINLSRVFDMMDKEGTGHITLTQLESLLADDQMLAYMQAMGVDAQDPWSLFRLLDIDASHAIDKNEFVAGMLRMRGQASSIDVQMLMEKQNWISKRMDSMRLEKDTLWMKAEDPCGTGEGGVHQCSGTGRGTGSDGSSGGCAASGPVDDAARDEGIFGT